MFKDHIDESIAKNEIRIDLNNKQYDPRIKNLHLSVKHKYDKRSSSINPNRKYLKWKFVLLPKHLHAWISRKYENYEAQSKHHILPIINTHLPYARTILVCACLKYPCHQYIEHYSIDLNNIIINKNSQPKINNQLYYAPILPYSTL